MQKLVINKWLFEIEHSLLILLQPQRNKLLFQNL